MAVYRVVNKAHVRATIHEQMAVDARGNPFTISHNGIPKRFEEGALIDDLTPEELEAFPDRFELVDASEARLHHAMAPQAAPQERATVQSHTMAAPMEEAPKTDEEPPQRATHGRQR